MILQNIPEKEILSGPHILIQRRSNDPRKHSSFKSLQQLLTAKSR